MHIRKRRSITQINEEKSNEIFRKLIPETWVMHEYGPDYGIDCIVELFDYIDEEKKIAETLGEVFYVQLKSSRNVNYNKRKVYARKNVEKYVLSEDKTKFYEIEVASFQLETSELLTVESMGPAIPVLLVLVDINTERAFYVCLNDYIDKIILPQDHTYSEKDSKVIHIPLCNEILLEEKNLVPLRAYGKRSKMYGAFNKFIYQNTEIKYLLESNVAFKEMQEVISLFTNSVLKQDIWEKHDFWLIISYYHNELIKISKKIEEGISGSEIEGFKLSCLITWNGLEVLSRNYEEIVREWFLPSYLSCEISN